MATRLQPVWNFLANLLADSDPAGRPLTDENARDVMLTVWPLVIAYILFLVAFCFWGYRVAHGLEPNAFQIW